MTIKSYRIPWQNTDPAHPALVADMLDNVVGVTDETERKAVLDWVKGLDITSLTSFTMGDLNCEIAAFLDGYEAAKRN